MENFFKVLKRKNIENQAISEFILMIINQNILATLLTFQICKKIYMRNFTPDTTSKTVTIKFFSKILNKKNISNEQFHLCETKIL